MKTMVTVISWLGLLLTLGPPVLMYAGGLDVTAMKALMFAGSLVWFGARLFGPRARPGAPRA
jgi:hypothetical protein